MYNLLHSGRGHVYSTQSETIFHSHLHFSCYNSFRVQGDGPCREIFWEIGRPEKRLQASDLHGKLHDPEKRDALQEPCANSALDNIVGIARKTYASLGLRLYWQSGGAGTYLSVCYPKPEVGGVLMVLLNTLTVLEGVTAEAAANLTSGLVDGWEV
jgi:hypothetical protein